MFAGACSCQFEDSHIECQLVVEGHFKPTKEQEPVPVSLNLDKEFSIALHYFYERLCVCGTFSVPLVAPLHHKSMLGHSS